MILNKKFSVNKNGPESARIDERVNTHVVCKCYINTLGVLWAQASIRTLTTGILKFTIFGRGLLLLRISGVSKILSTLTVYDHIDSAQDVNLYPIG